ncbi:LmeA family phospholipid-binding protein [Streptomyces phaeoluteigriseus]|uniref:LmeA family phospholipid-binding protein n=1 Tax=Streptomyces phaeoluteigriseus TaxID=114686 RepID=UPI0036CEFE76
MATPRRPSVLVSGFPVLTQLAGGRLRHVDIAAADIPAHGTTRPLPVTRLTVGLDGLKTSGSADEAHARSAQATAFLSYEDVSGVLGLEISPGHEPGRVDAPVSLPLAGEVSVSSAVSATGGNRIAFTDVRVTQGELIPSARALLAEALEEPVPLHTIPDGLNRTARCPAVLGRGTRGPVPRPRGGQSRGCRSRIPPAHEPALPGRPGSRAPADQPWPFTPGERTRPVSGWWRLVRGLGQDPLCRGADGRAAPALPARRTEDAGTGMSGGAAGTGSGTTPHWRGGGSAGSCTAAAPVPLASDGTGAAAPTGGGLLAVHPGVGVPARPPPCGFST